MGETPSCPALEAAGASELVADDLGFLRAMISPTIHAMSGDARHHLRQARGEGAFEQGGFTPTKLHSWRVAAGRSR